MLQLLFDARATCNSHYILYIIMIMKWPTLSNSSSKLTQKHPRVRISRWRFDCMLNHYGVTHTLCTLYVCNVHVQWVVIKSNTSKIQTNNYWFQIQYVPCKETLWYGMSNSEPREKWFILCWPKHIYTYISKYLLIDALEYRLKKKYI